MPGTILLTAFEPYDDWEENAGWLALVELTRHLPRDARIITRRYPVDFSRIRQSVQDDLKSVPDLAIHLGQAPGSARLALEAVALNVRGHVHDGRDRSQSAEGVPQALPDGAAVLCVDGPPAYRTSLPLASLAEQLNACGLPAAVSFHAGTFLCNAVYYWSQHLARQQQLPTRSLFIHVPLAPEQAGACRREFPSMTPAAVAAAVSLIAAELG